jgi:hypothetical protein
VISPFHQNALTKGLGTSDPGAFVFTDVLGIADLLVVEDATSMPHREPEAAEWQVGLEQMLPTQV